LYVGRVNWKEQLTKWMEGGGAPSTLTEMPLIQWLALGTSVTNTHKMTTKADWAAWRAERKKRKAEREGKK
jgi:hypothetical protein